MRHKKYYKLSAGVRRAGEERKSERMKARRRRTDGGTDHHKVRRARCTVVPVTTPIAD